MRPDLQLYDIHREQRNDLMAAAAIARMAHQAAREEEIDGGEVRADAAQAKGYSFAAGALVILALLLG